MTARYALIPVEDDPAKFAIRDTIDHLVVETLPRNEAIGKLVELNKADRVEKMRAGRGGKRDKPKVGVEQILQWKRDGLTFAQIGALAGMSAPCASNMHGNALRAQRFAENLKKHPINDKTLIVDTEMLMRARTLNALIHPVTGYGLDGTVGAIRSTPDALLKKTPNIGQKGLADLRRLFGYAWDYSRHVANPKARLVDYLDREQAA